MELYLDSTNMSEIEEAFELGFLYGLTTTPTFMHRDGITDIDGTILKLAKIVPVLQVEAMGERADEIIKEANRLLSLGLNKETTVFKIPISLEGAKACKKLVDDGLMVNLHLVYTVQQAYIAFSAGATYVCPLVGRLQDQGHDALDLIDQCVKAVKTYGYNTKVMFSSVRHPEHVRNAIKLGVHACTIPWNVMKELAKSHMTDIGTQQFLEHTRLMTLKVKEVIRKDKGTINVKNTIMDALIEMTRTGLGAVTLVDGKSNIVGMFTDGDLRRLLEANGEGVLKKHLSELNSSKPLTIDANESLYACSKIFGEKKVDNIVVVENGLPVGILDIQDLMV
jgi:TalC/MipB family fructose-6-phosphate aldolase